jgi:23S rRNA (pseudouridine1915-N3)-methyltransferase
MKIELLFLGKTKEPYLAAGIAEYAERLAHYARLEIRELKDRGRKNSLSPAEIIEAEGRLLLLARTKSSLLVALDRSGRGLSSEEFAHLIKAWEGQGTKGLSFIIGGPLGLSATVLRQADFILSFSKMTFTHDMARFLLVEQLYRAYTINAGSRYHK